MAPNCIVTTDFLGDLIAGPQERTFSFWLYNSATSSGTFSMGYGGMTGSSAPSTTGSFNIEVKESGNMFYISVDLGEGIIEYECARHNIGWHYYTVIVPNKVNLVGSDVRFYQDGRLLITKTRSDGDAVSINTIVGKLFNFGGQFNGIISDVRIFNREITDVEVFLLYHQANW
jgi:hypothetical protein